MKELKKHASLDDQVSLLSERGLLIEDEQSVKKPPPGAGTPGAASSRVNGSGACSPSILPDIGGKSNDKA